MRKLLLILIAAAAASPIFAQGADRILWSVQTDGTIPNAFITTAPDGTIYAADNLGLYAFEPDGTRRWFTAGAGFAPISLGADGTIYTGGALITAVNPDGTIKWVFDANDNPFCLLAGPNVGPDGNIYAVQDFAICDGLGAFALDPNGNLLWSDPGSPQFISFPGSSGNIVFTPTGLFAGVITNAGTSPVTWAYDFDGSQRWSTADLGLSAGSMPFVDPFNRIIFRWGQVGIQAVSEQDGDIQWISTHPHGGSLLTGITIESTGNIYVCDWLDLDLWALEPDGSTLWSKAPGQDDGLCNDISIAPTESVLVLSGGGSFGESGELRGYDPADGSLMWEVPFPLLDGQLQLIWTVEPAYSPDGSVAYITTRDTGDPEFSIVHAVDITGRDIDPEPTLTITGSCPGPVTVEVTQMTPSGRVALLRSDELGDGFLQRGPCAGTRTGFDNPVLQTTIRADQNGVATLSRSFPPAACGFYIQAIDATTCATTNVVPLP